MLRPGARLPPEMKVAEAGVHGSRNREHHRIVHDLHHR
jgi:hypothetical protein